MKKLFYTTALLCSMTEFRQFGLGVSMLRPSCSQNRSGLPIHSNPFVYLALQWEGSENSLKNLTSCPFIDKWHHYNLQYDIFCQYIRRGINYGVEDIFL